MTAALAPRIRTSAAAATTRALHVVQVSRDELLLDPERGAESWARQQAYAAELERRRPGSRMTVLVLTSDRQAQTRAAGTLCVLPVAGLARGVGRLLVELRLLHRERPIDVVTTQSPFEEMWVALLFAKLESVRVVGQIHFDPFAPAFTAGPASTLRRLRLRLALASLRWLHSLRVVSRAVEDGIVERGLHRRVSVVPVPVGALERPLPAAAPPSPRVVYVGRLAPEKGLADWLQVAARVARRVPEAEFVWVGAGPSEGELLARARALGLEGRLHLRGFVPNGELDEVYRSASALLLTSRHEGFGRVLVEAAGCETPAVATRTAGASEVIRPGETGFLHAHGDVDGMAESLVRLLRDDALRARMGRAAARRVRDEFRPAHLRRAWVGMLVAAAREDLGPIATPRLRTWTRWRRLAFAKGSLLRLLEEEAIEGTVLEGRVLDLGGGGRASYLRLLRPAPGARVESANFDPRVLPTHRLDLEEPLPFADDSFDQILSLNTLEHLERDERALGEALRVLRPGGRFHVAVPFLYRAHGSPRDHHRHTAEWWASTLERCGADPAELRVEPLVWDRVATAASFFSGPLSRLLRPALLAPAVLADLRFGRNGARRLPDCGASRRLIEVAVGWSISGTKREARR